jgi:hypothetical protein
MADGVGCEHAQEVAMASRQLAAQAEHLLELTRALLGRAGSKTSSEPSEPRARRRG